MDGWQPISTAPKDGTVIRLRHTGESERDFYDVMLWDATRQEWVGMAFPPFGGPVRTHWPKDAKEQPTEWHPLYAPEARHAD